MFMYNSLTDLPDISSLPASLFSTPVKLSNPFSLNFMVVPESVLKALKYSVKASESMIKVDKRFH